MKNFLIIGLVLFSLIIAGCVQPQQKNSGEKILADGTIEKADGTMIKPDGTMVKPDGTMVKPDGTMIKPDGTVIEPSNNSGEAMVKTSSYTPFTQAEYDKAKSEGKIIFLEFYANWCPICKTQEPQIEAAFPQIKNEKIIGFRVNYNDSDTDNDEKDLAREFGITYQHTHVILNSTGIVEKKSLEFWDSETIKSEIAKVAGI